MSYVKLRSFVWRLWGPGTGERGQTLFEFTLIAAMVALVAVVALSALGVAIVAFFQGVLPGFGA
jgi:Flp pilus assembly pilin Flp